MMTLYDCIFLNVIFRPAIIILIIATLCLIMRNTVFRYWKHCVSAEEMYSNTYQFDWYMTS